MLSLRFAAVAAILVSFGGSAFAQDVSDGMVSRPVVSTYSFETGRRNVYAAYLSPLHYKGPAHTISGSWIKGMPFSNHHALMHTDASASFSRLENPAHTAAMVGLDLEVKWGMSWRTHLPWQLQVTAGGTVDLSGGAYYLLRNGNNPVEAMARAGMSARGSLARVVKFGRFDFLVSDEVSLPMFGAFFCPDYGETYYEIYLGNHKGLVHGAWWGNNFGIDNLLAVTLDLGRTAVKLGYRYELNSQWANNLYTKIHTHSIVIGIVPGGIGLKRKPRRIAEIINPLY